MTHRVPGLSARIQVRRWVHVRVNGLGRTAHVSAFEGALVVGHMARYFRPWTKFRAPTRNSPSVDRAMQLFNESDGSARCKQLCYNAQK
jgi:hypothetical protein